MLIFFLVLGGSNTFGLSAGLGAGVGDGSHAGSSAGSGAGSGVVSGVGSRSDLGIYLLLEISAFKVMKNIFSCTKK